MFDQRLRQTKDQVLVPIAEVTLKDVHPVALTLLGGVIGILCGLAALAGQYPLALALWAVNRIVDGLDGTVARTTGKSSDMGGYLDTLVDHVVYAFIVVMLALSQPSTENLLALILLLAIFYVNAASWMMLSSILEKRNEGARKNKEQTTVAMTKSLIEGGEAILFYALFLIFPQYLAELYALLAFLLVLTMCQRLIWAYRNLT